MDALIQDLRYALRAFARTPPFTAAAVLSITIGVGANGAVFSVASALLLRPLPSEGDAHAPWTTVVGVVGSVKQFTLDSDSRIAMYLVHASSRHER